MVIGLSGAGKSNLAGFLTHHAEADSPVILIDCNQLQSADRSGLFGAMARAMGASAANAGDPLDALDAAIGAFLETRPRLTFVLDRFDALPWPERASGDGGRVLHNNLRALRDRHKFKLTYVLTARKALPRESELSELFFANSIWLGPLNESDARWNIERFAARRGEAWPAPAVDAILAVSRGYPSFLKAACEAVADGCPLDALAAHDAVTRRVDEFWSDSPTADVLTRLRLKDHPLLRRSDATVFDTTQLTAKEHLLLRYFQAHPNEVCEKDDLIKAVWSEDKAYVKGIRDDSLAQLVRRLREKIEPDASAPKHIIAVPGRGYRFVPK